MTKISQLPSNSPLIGDEPMAFVQGEGDIAITPRNVAGLISDQPTVVLGKHASVFPAPNNVAIGYEAVAGLEGSVACGGWTYAVADNTIAFGYRSAAFYVGGTVVGYNTFANSPKSTLLGIGVADTAYTGYGTALGSYANPAGVGVVTIGYHAHATYGEGSVAIGKQVSSSGDNAIGIGDHVDVALTMPGPFVYSGNAIGIGTYARAAAYCIAIGTEAGVYAPYDAFSVKIGFATSSLGPVGVSIGKEAGTIFGVSMGNRSISGYRSVIVGQYSVVFSSDGVGIGLGVGFADHGLAIGGYARAYGASSMALGTSAQSDIAGSLTISHGHFSGLNPTLRYFNLTGHTPIDNSSLLTADGGSVSEQNQVSLPAGSIGTISGRVVAAVPDLFTTGVDAASFVLEPTMVARDNSLVYSFLSIPVFTPEISSVAAADWPVPTIAINGTNLSITVNSIDVELDWMAHIKFETSS